MNPAETVQSQRVIAKEAEVKQLMLLLDEVIPGFPRAFASSASLLHCICTLQNELFNLTENPVSVCRQRQGWRPTSGSSL